MTDNINHPSHYTKHPSGIECIDVAEHLTYNIGNALKYIWRHDLKGDWKEDLEKAIWYLNREVERREQLERNKVTTDPKATGGPKYASLNSSYPEHMEPNEGQIQEA